MRPRSLAGWVLYIAFPMLHVRCIQGQGEEQSTVKLNFFTAIGKKITYGKKDFYVYKNIPYANPINRSSRFQPAEPLSTQTETDPNKIVPCPQVYHRPKDPNDGSIIGEEDCLFLDVYSTQAPQDKKFPVFVYFHGGKFSRGHKDEYIPSYLMREEDMVVVIPNYRLGVLGFLCTQDTELSGNVGLLDQQLVLKWVNENIGSFGGDGSHVTIGGHGAGGVSCSLHILAEDSKGYFSAVIAGSGVAMDPWAMARKSRSSAEALSKQMSCPTSSSKAMVACLRTKPLEDLMNAQKTLTNITFGPVVDGIFLSETPKALYEKKTQSVPFLGGITKDEASLEFFTEFEEASKEGNLDTMLTHLLYRYLDESNNPDIVIKAAKYHYLRGVSAPNLLGLHEQIISLMTDFLYNSGLVQTLKSHSSVNENVWMYVFQYEGSKSLGEEFGPPNEEYDGNYGISHMDDVLYLFNTTFVDLPDDSKIDKIITRYVKIWKTFILTRDLPYEKWNFSAAEKYIEFALKGDASKANYKQNDMDFWNLLVPDLQVANSSGHVEKQVVDAKVSTTNWGVAGMAIMLAVLCVALAAVVVVMRKKFTRKCNTSHSRDKTTSGV